MTNNASISADSLLLSQLIEGNPKALESLFNKYYTFLIRFAIQITKREEASEDVVQEVFIKLWDKRHTLEGVRDIKSYLFKATKNSSLNWIKSSDNKYDFNLSEDHFSSTDNSVEDYIAFEETQNKIEVALLKIPEKCRQIFIASRNEGKTYKEIAADLGISIKTVENQMGKALKILRSELGVTLFIIYLIHGL